MVFLGNYTLKIILPIIFILIFSICSFAQKSVDVIHFKSGNIVKGKIKEISHETIKMKTKQGNVYIFRKDNILKITRELIKKTYDPKFFVFISGGYTIPAYETDFWKTYDPGVCFNIGCGYKFSRLFTLRLDFQYSMFPYHNHMKKSIYSNKIYYIEGSELSFSTGKLDLLINSPFNSNINLYGVIGTGVYFLTKGSLTNPNDRFMKIYKMGFNAGGGVSIKLLKNSIYLFAETQYNHVIGPESEKGYIPIKLGFLFIPFIHL
jgi:opacity protein-like surface antigen